MAKIIVAFSQKAVTRQAASVLETAGFPVFRTCATGNEVMRAFNLCQDGILVCGTHFADRTVNDLAYDMGERALILAVGHADRLEVCDHPDIFTLCAPFSKGELTSAVSMLVQLHYKRMPHRPEEEKEIIERAKRKLMEERGLTEAEAHRLLQQESMRRGVKMAHGALELLK